MFNAGLKAPQILGSSHMPSIVKTLAGATAVLALSSPTHAQGLVTEKNIPLAMAQGIADGRIKPGQLLLIEAMGGGLTWGAAVIRL